MNCIHTKTRVAGLLLIFSLGGAAAADSGVPLIAPWDEPKASQQFDESISTYSPPVDRREQLPYDSDIYVEDATGDERYEEQYDNEGGLYPDEEGMEVRFITDEDFLRI